MNFLSLVLACQVIHCPGKGRPTVLSKVFQVTENAQSFLVPLPTGQVSLRFYEALPDDQGQFPYGQYQVTGSLGTLQLGMGLGDPRLPFAAHAARVLSDGTEEILTLKCSPSR